MNLYFRSYKRHVLPTFSTHFCVNRPISWTYWIRKNSGSLVRIRISENLNFVSLTLRAGFSYRVTFMNCNSHYKLDSYFLNYESELNCFILLGIVNFEYIFPFFPTKIHKFSAIKSQHRIELQILFYFNKL